MTFINCPHHLGNLVYSIKATEMFPIRPRDDPSSNAFRKLWNKLNKKLSQTSAEIAESRYMGLFQFVDMTKDFFFSYSYDLTRSLQHNYVNLARQKERQKASSHPSAFIDAFHPQEIFEWNHFQLQGTTCIFTPLPISYQMSLSVMMIESHYMTMDGWVALQICGRSWDLRTLRSGSPALFWAPISRYLTCSVRKRVGCVAHYMLATLRCLSSEALFAVR